MPLDCLLLNIGQVPILRAKLFLKVVPQRKRTIVSHLEGFSNLPSLDSLLDSHDILLDMIDDLQCYSRRD